MKQGRIGDFFNKITKDKPETEVTDIFEEKEESENRKKIGELIERKNNHKISRNQRENKSTDSKPKLVKKAKRVIDSSSSESENGNNIVDNENSSGLKSIEVDKVRNGEKTQDPHVNAGNQGTLSAEKYGSSETKKQKKNDLFMPTDNKSNPTPQETKNSYVPNDQDEASAAHQLVDLDLTKVKSEAIAKQQEELKYSEMCDMFVKVGDTTKRLEKLSILTKFFVNVLGRFDAQKDGSIPLIVICIYLCINRIAPDYENLELGIGEQVLMKAVSEATGRTIAKVKQDTVRTGDLGTVAQESRSNQGTLFKPRALTVPAVFNTLKEIAAITGHSSMQRKVNKIKAMLVSCHGDEAKFLIRSLEGKLRIGLAEKTVLVALAHASVIFKNADKKISKEDLESDLLKAAETVKAAFSELPNYELIIPPLIEFGYQRLDEHCKLVPGVPVKPMLAHPTKSLTDVLSRFNNIDFLCEYKYDGERAQIHCMPSGEIKIYSRNSENMTPKYPDIIANAEKFANKNSKSYVLDCEAVAWNREEKKILPFQVLSTRKRKDVKEEDIKVQVVVFAFDLLYLNGESLLRHSLEDRKRLLLENFQEIEGIFTFAKSMETNQVEEIQTFLDESIMDNCEGLMVKVLKGTDSSYEPSKRSRNWLKVKKDYLEGIGDSLDLVVIGAYTGRGKRTGVYGGYLLACYDSNNEEYQTICKIGTGFSEQNLISHFAELEKHIIPAPKSYYNYNEALSPDIWFEPALVWEVKAADLSISPTYKAGIGKCDPTKGISLRFPRFIRVREDKKPEMATTSDQVADMFRMQQTNAQQEKDKIGFVDDNFEY